jgi:hypothetical protein
MVGGSLPELRQEGAQPEVGRKKACACTQKGGRPGRGQDLSKRSPTDAGQQAPGPCLHASGTGGGDRLIVRSNSPERRSRGGMRRDVDGPVWIAPRQTNGGASEDAAGAKEAQFLRACRIRSYYIRIVKLKIVTLIALTEDGEGCEGSEKRPDNGRHTPPTYCRKSNFPIHWASYRGVPASAFLVRGRSVIGRR